MFAHTHTRTHARTHTQSQPETSSSWAQTLRHEVPHSLHLFGSCLVDPPGPGPSILDHHRHQLVGRSFHHCLSCHLCYYCWRPEQASSPLAAPPSPPHKNNPMSTVKGGREEIQQALNGHSTPQPSRENDTHNRGKDEMGNFQDQ